MVRSTKAMSGSHVLVIEDDEWVARLLAVGLREAGHRVTLCHDGAGGITSIHREAPDCVVCEVELPDVDGFSIGRSMRHAGGRVAATPLVFLCAREEKPETLLDSMRAGGDAFLRKPLRIDEVAAIVTALIRLAERNRGVAGAAAPVVTAATMAPPPPPVPTPPKPAADQPDGVLEGDLSKVSVATILTVLEMEKHTGELEMSRGDRHARIHLEAGTVHDASLGDTQAEPIAVLRTVLTWTGGRFRFVPSKKPERKLTGRATIAGLLMEAARLEDEYRAGRPDATDAAGGTDGSRPPPSRVSDFFGAFPAAPSSPPKAESIAPPSSRRAPPSRRDRLSTTPSASEVPATASVPAPPAKEPSIVEVAPAAPTPAPSAATPAPATTGVATTALVDDGWDGDDEPPSSLQAVELESVRRGPPPVPPPRKGS